MFSRRHAAHSGSRRKKNHEVFWHQTKRGDYIDEWEPYKNRRFLRLGKPEAVTPATPVSLLLTAEISLRPSQPQQIPP